MNVRMNGAIVLYCGHTGVFVADLFEVGSAMVVRASHPVTPDNIIRDGSLGAPTHHLVDFPTVGFWRPDLGTFVVPRRQCKALAKSNEQKGPANE